MPRTITPELVALAVQRGIDPVVLLNLLDPSPDDPAPTSSNTASQAGSLFAGPSALAAQEEYHHQAHPHPQLSLPFFPPNPFSSHHLLPPVPNTSTPFSGPYHSNTHLSSLQPHPRPLLHPSSLQRHSGPSAAHSDQIQPSSPILPTNAVTTYSS